jgi:hypothetical protein
MLFSQRNASQSQKDDGLVSCPFDANHRVTENKMKFHIFNKCSLYVKTTIFLHQDYSIERAQKNWHSPLFLQIQSNPHFLH